MMKNKFVAFATAFSVMASMSTGFVSVYAADPADDTTESTVATVNTGLELVYDAEASTETTRVVNAYYRGIDGVAGAAITLGFSINTVEKVVLTTEFSSQVTENNENLASGWYAMNFSRTEGMNTEDNLFGTFTITVPEDTGEFTVTVTDTDITDSSFSSIGNEDVDQSSVVVPEYSPAETEKPSEEATEAPTATAEPTATPVVVEKPTAVPTEPAATDIPVATVNTGLELVYDAEASSETTRVVNAYYRGINGVAGAAITLGFSINTVEKVALTTELSTQITENNENLANGWYAMNFSRTEGMDTENNLFGTFTITVPEGTGEFTVTVTDTDITDSSFNSVLTDDVDESWVIVPEFGAEEPSETPAPTEFPADDTVNVKDMGVKAEETDATYGTLTAIVVNVTKDGAEAVYGEDYVAVFDGKELTKDEYQNLINGYGGKTITEVIEGLSFKAVYGVTINVSPAYQTEDQVTSGQMTVVPGYGAEVTVEEAVDPEKTYTLTVEESNRGYVIVTPVDSTYASGDTEDGDFVVKDVASGAQFKLTAVADSGYTFSGWSGDATGSSTSKTITVTKNMTVSAKFTSSSSSGSSSGSGSSSSSGSSSGSGSGQIARPGQSGTATGTTTGFQDISTVPWAVDAINTLASLGIINGRSDTIFDPNASVTRAEFTKMVCLTFGFAETPNASQKFVDVTPSDWFYGYVMAAASNGIVNGVSDTAFDPNATITRQDMAAILYRAASATGMLTAMSTGEAINFADYDQISDYAVAPVTTLSAAGVINGTTDNKFEPLATATRAQAACIIYQYYQAIGAI